MPGRFSKWRLYLEQMLDVKMPFMKSNPSVCGKKNKEFLKGGIVEITEQKLANSAPAHG